MSSAKLYNEKLTSEQDWLKYDLNARNKENVRLAEDLVIEKRSNASKDSKIYELSHELEKLKSDIDQRVRLEKKHLKAEVIQTGIELFQENYLDMDFQWKFSLCVQRES